MVDKSVIQPISKASEMEVFKLDLLTTSYEQNVEAGRVATEGGLVLADTVLTLGTTGEYAIAKSGKLVKMFSGAAEDVATGARKLPDGGASGKIPLHPSISHHPKKKGPPKDGKFKTHAKSLGERFEELEAAIGKLLGKMPKDLADRMPFKVAYMQKAGTNQRVPTIVKNSDHPMYSKVDGGNDGNGGGSGRRAEGARHSSKVEVSYGKHIEKKGRKKVLQPNVKYTTPEGYTYETNKFGRIESVEADLQLGKGSRNKYAQSNVGEKERIRGDYPERDDGGHLIGSQFKGSGDIDNLVPMNSQINEAGGKWHQMEQEWASALDAKESVKVRIKPQYTGSSARPDSFMVEYSINEGRKKKITIKNQIGG